MRRERLATATLALLCALFALDASHAAAQEQASGLGAPRIGSTREPIAKTDPDESTALDHVPERAVLRPLVLPAGVIRVDIAALGAGSSTYSPTFGFIAQGTFGVADGLELFSGVPFLAGMAISPTLGAHFRYFASKPVELGVRTVVGIPVNSSGSVTQDAGLTALWRPEPWLSLSTEVRAALAYTSPSPNVGIDWPLAATFQVTSAFFFGVSSELLYLASGPVIVYPVAHRVSWAPGLFLGVTANHRGHATVDSRIAVAIRDVAASGIGVEVVMTFSFYMGDIH